MSDSNEKPASSFQEDSLKNEQDDPVEPDSPITSQSMQSKESPLILKEFDDKSSQEGIEDAFSQDQGDRFQSKNKKENKVKSDQEKIEANK